MSVQCGISAGRGPKCAKLFGVNVNAPRRCLTTAAAADLIGQTDMHEGTHRHPAETATPSETKTCRTCGIAKPMSGFRPNVRKGHTYYRSNCRDCDNAGGREWRRNRVAPLPPAMLPLDEFSTQVCRICKQELPLDHFGPNKSMRVGLRRECKKCLSDRASRWVAENPDKAFDTYLRRTYDITLEQYNRHLTEQEGCCAICGEPPTVENSGRWTKRRRRPAPPKLIVDHDHKTGKVRGLLCGRCNTGIGALKDDAAIVRFALKYLEERGE